MRVITFGTGAGRPTLHRAASAVGLEIQGETFLFDCGEGTQLQLMKSPFKWGKLEAIFIGHLHGDHVNGLPGLLGTLSLSDRVAPLRVFGPKGLKKFIGALMECQSTSLHYPLLLEEVDSPGKIFESKTGWVETHPLEHSIECWGYVFREWPRPGHFNVERAERIGLDPGPLRAKLIQGEAVSWKSGEILLPEDFVGPERPGRSMAYCLDTRPCAGAVDLAKNVDLLVYEATFAAAIQQEAHAYGHSASIDGAEVAKAAGVKRLVLTHFSQRYGDVRALHREAAEIFPETFMAHDLAVFEIR